MIISAIRQIDIYGAKVEIKFQKNALHKTTFGGIITLAICLFMAYLSYQTINDLIERKNPTIIISERFVASPERIYLNKNNTIIMVGLENGNATSFADPLIFTVDVKQILMKKYNDSITNESKMDIQYNYLSLKICDETDFALDRAYDYFLKVPLEQLYCINQYHDSYIEGDFDQNNFSKLEFTFKQCVNSTENNNSCRSQHEIDHQIKKAYFQMYLLDQMVDPQKFGNPFQPQGRDYYTPVSNQQGKDLQISFTNYYVQTDMGLIQEDIVLDKEVTFADTRETELFNDSGIICTVQIRPYKHREKLMIRRYPKLIEVVSQLGGFLKVIVLIGSILTFQLQNFILNKNIVNQIFNFQINEENNKINDENNPPIHFRRGFNIISSPKSQELNGLQLEQKLSQQNQETAGNRGRLDSCNPQFVKIQNKLIENQSFSSSPHQEPQIAFQRKPVRRRSLIEVAKQYFKPIKKIISYSSLDYILHCFYFPFKGMRFKKPILNHGIKKIENHLDIIFILNKFIEIDKLKTILLDKDQLKLFNYLPKPEIQADNNSKNLTIINNTYHEEKCQEEKALDAYEGLVNILKKENKSNQDLMLMELIDPAVSKLAAKNFGRLTLVPSQFPNTQKCSPQFKLSQFDFKILSPKRFIDNQSSFTNENTLEMPQSIFTPKKFDSNHLIELSEFDEQPSNNIQNNNKSHQPYKLVCKQTKQFQ